MNYHVLNFSKLFPLIFFHSCHQPIIKNETVVPFPEFQIAKELVPRNSPDLKTIDYRVINYGDTSSFKIRANFIEGKISLQLFFSNESPFTSQIREMDSVVSKICEEFPKDHLASFSFWTGLSLLGDMSVNFSKEYFSKYNYRFVPINVLQFIKESSLHSTLNIVFNKYGYKISECEVEKLGCYHSKFFKNIGYLSVDSSEIPQRLIDGWLQGSLIQLNP